MTDIIARQHVAGIHSKQPWFVLSASQFYTHQTPKHPYISHFYSFTMDCEAGETIAIPDGCVDLLFDCDNENPASLVCGTTLQAREVRFNPHHSYFGVRFIPGIVPDFLNVIAAELIEQQSSLTDVVCDSNYICEQVVKADSFMARVNLINSFLEQKQARIPSRLTSQLVAKICAEKGNIQVQDLERYSGYTTRTLQRQFQQDIGLTPKTFIRAIRCQSAVYSINHLDNVTFTDLASGLGFSDQAHFLREFKKLVHATPMQYQHKVQQNQYLDHLTTW
ncbi:helix-turn-helix domain-containing protein [Vibrio nitrifigilis]|uniref:AraC family transcriptional regulator n=1 Tax=Vibrio nitrifigilis TaxID=2789781 RepID=A0ABS0GK99_9VIBR|nr:helix-turn-helix domain-containing protein [Vibrio nitrifigilis]MBF9002857.1 AraC family transcriptional regulator [Vibrio nitrifigilis]